MSGAPVYEAAARDVPETEARLREHRGFGGRIALDAEDGEVALDLKKLAGLAAQAVAALPAGEDPDTVHLVVSAECYYESTTAHSRHGAPTNRRTCPLLLGLDLKEEAERLEFERLKAKFEGATK